MTQHDPLSLPDTVRHAYRLIGMRRSGNHAFVTWLVESLGRPCVFYNDVMSPLNPAPRGLLQQPGGESHSEISPEAVIISYEDVQYHHAWPASSFIQSEHPPTDVILLRDPFNLFASRIRFSQKSRESRHSSRHLVGLYRWRRVLELIDTWIDNFDSAMGEDAPSRPIAVLYDRWLASSEYRAYLAGELQLPRAADPPREVPRYGGGSSFDGQGFAGQAHLMDVHQRWAQLADNPLWRRCVLDRRIQQRLAKVDAWRHLVEEVRQRCRPHRISDTIRARAYCSLYLNWSIDRSPYAALDWLRRKCPPAHRAVCAAGRRLRPGTNGSAKR